MDNWQNSTIEKVLLETIKEQRRSRRWRLFFHLIYLLIIGIVIFNFLDNNNNARTITKTKHVAIVKLNGTISDENQTYTTITEGLNNALKNDNTVAVIIQANSPGGSPVYSNMIYNKILQLRKQYPTKPIDVVVEEVCASGCYYIATSANKIYANPASIIGSIGVIYTGFGLTGLIQKLGIESRLIIAGKNKAMGYPFIPNNNKQTQMQQQILDEIHEQFIAAVKNGRGNRLAKNDPDIFSGRYWIGEDGLKLGLIDGFDTVDNIAKEQFKTDKIVDFTPKQNTVDKIIKKLSMSIVGFASDRIELSQVSSYN